MKRRRLIAVLIVVVVLGLVSWAWPRPEPEYKGRKLSEWVDSVQAIGLQEEAVNAVRQIGTNGLPFLLAWLCYEPNRGREAVAFRLTRILPYRVVKAIKGRGGDRQNNAGFCFGILGDTGSPAIPRLVELINRTNCPETAMYALSALGETGKRSIPALLAIMEKGNPTARAGAIGKLGDFAEDLGTNAKPLVPKLIAYMNEQDPAIVQITAGFLGRLRLEPAVVVPALLRVVEHPEVGVRLDAIWALAEFGSDARSALPAFSRAARTDSEILVREEAKRALRIIAPEVLKTNRADHL